MKILALFQKAEEKKKADSADSNGLLTEKDIAQLFSEVTDLKGKSLKELPSA
jgi:pyruvate-formate lyase-activating enzyme